MKRLLRFILVLAGGLVLAPFLPLYVERTMLRSWLVNPPGTLVEWGWKLTTLSDYWSNYNYFQSEQRPALWLLLNCALAFTYALIVALLVDQFSVRRRRRGQLVSE